VTLLVLGLVAASYTTVGRLLRVRSWSHPPERSGREVLLPQLDLGPVAGAVWGPGLAGRLGWAVPAFLRLLELGAVLLVTELVAPHAMPWAYALCFVLAYHHYDTLYRALGGAEPPRWLVLGGLGVEGRVALLLLVGALGPDALTVALGVGCVVLGGWFVLLASGQLVRSLTSGGTA
jgi:hypothetical protein